MPREQLKVLRVPRSKNKVAIYCDFVAVYFAKKSIYFTLISLYNLYLILKYGEYAMANTCSEVRNYCWILSLIMSGVL